MYSTFLFISGAEIIVVVLIVIMIFGTDKIPEIARGLGKSIRQLKETTNDIKKDIKDSVEKNDVSKNVVKDINNEVNEVKDTVDDFTKPVKRK